MKDCITCGNTNIYYEPSKGSLVCRDCGTKHEINAKEMPTLEFMMKRIVSIVVNMEHIKWLQHKFFYNKEDKVRRYAATYNILVFIEHDEAYEKDNKK